MTTYGKVQSLEDFKKLSFRDPAEAEKLFRSRDFYEILKYEDKRIQALYDNMRKWELDQQALEEFFGGLQAEREDFSDAGRGEQGIYFSSGIQKRYLYDQEEYVGISDH